jgi:hypothetical protein
MTATRIASNDERLEAFIAAPYAGMTQTGSTGVLSAALPRHPWPCLYNRHRDAVAQGSA